MFNHHTYRVLLCSVVVSCLANQASADLLTFDSLPVVNDVNLPYTTFHSAQQGDGTGGDILGWANLQPGTVSTYDPDTGDIDLRLTIYGSRDTAETNNPLNAIGNAHGVSSNMKASDFNQFDAEVIGNITWTFDFNVILVFFPDDFPSTKPPVTMSFVDFDYVTTANNNTANTWDGKTMTLWGADGTYLGANFEGGGKFDVETTSIGFDFVGITSGTMVPEPSSNMLLILGTSCLGGVVLWKRRGNCLPQQA